MKIKLWKIFARERSHSEDSEDYAAECYKSNVIAIGWNNLGNLSKLDSRAEIKAKLLKTYKKAIQGKLKRAESWAGSLWSFKNSVQKNHIVLCPDKKAECVYIGRVLSKHVYYDDKHSMERFYFAHRRRVQWFQKLNQTQIRSIWKDGRFGGLQTVSEVKKGLDQLERFLRRPILQKPQRIGRVPWRPDKEWGRLAEIRAMRWLGKDARDVAHLCLGWDIECNGEKFEVKGRKSEKTLIRLTQNEWNAAKKHGKGFTILLFTAPTKEKLEEAEPLKIPDPARTEKWKKRATYEYFLNEL